MPTDFTVEPLGHLTGLHALIKDIALTDVKAIRQRNRDSQRIAAAVAKAEDYLEIFAQAPEHVQARTKHQHAVELVEDMLKALGVTM